MRKSRTLAKRINALLSAFVFFIGVFFCVGERVEASGSEPLYTNVFYDYGVFSIGGKSLWDSSEHASSSLPFTIAIPFDSVDYEYHYVTSSSGILSATEVPQFTSFDFSVPFYSFLQFPTSVGDGYVSGRFVFTLNFRFLLEESNINLITVDAPELEIYNPSGERLNSQVVSFTSRSVTFQVSLFDSVIRGTDNYFSGRIHFKAAANGLFNASGSRISIDDFSFNDLPIDIVSYSPSFYSGSPSTDELYGYDSSAGDSAADSFGQGVSEYDQAEGNLFDSSSDAIGDFSFVSLDSVPAVTTSISFVSSIMTMIFDQSGGLTGAGIVMSISLCALIGSIVVGIYRYWHKDG